MTIKLTIVPLIPKRLVIDATTFVNDLDRELAINFSGAVIRDMTNYPEVKPWARGFPKKGPRKGGRRTGRYGRNWKLSLHRRGTVVEVTNRTPYAVHVGGPTIGEKGRRQALFMGPRGWLAINTVVGRHWPSTQRAIARIIAGTGRSNRIARARAGLTRL